MKKTVSKNELVPNVHPWCGKTFSIERQLWDFEASPQMCCIEHCDVDTYSCDFAKNNWSIFGCCEGKSKTSKSLSKKQASFN